MRDDSVFSEQALVRECLSGSQDAWNEFHRKFSGLIRSVVVRRLGFNRDQLEDICQDALVALVSALQTYDSSHSLAKFVCVVTERVCIDQYRFNSAGKRAGDTQSLDHHDIDNVRNPSTASADALQDERLSSAQQAHLLRLSIRRLAQKCRELLKMRFEQELQFKEIALVMQSTENAVTVQTKRCIDELRARYAEIQQKGAGK